MRDIVASHVQRLVSCFVTISVRTADQDESRRDAGQLGPGRTAKEIARSFGGFVQQVVEVGLPEALRRNGLQDLVGRTAQETLLGIMSLCGGTDGSIDSVDARNALSRTMDELLRRCR